MHVSEDGHEIVISMLTRLCVGVFGTDKMSCLWRCPYRGVLLCLQTICYCIVLSMLYIHFGCGWKCIPEWRFHLKRDFVKPSGAWSLALGLRQRIHSFKHIHKFLCIGGIIREVGDGGGDGGDAVIFRLCCIKQKF